MHLNVGCCSAIEEQLRWAWGWLWLNSQELPVKNWSSSSRTLTLQSSAVNRDHFSFSICSDTTVLNILFPWRESEWVWGWERERYHISFSGKCSLPYKNEIKPMLSWFFYILTINKKKTLLTVHCTCIYSLWSLSGKCKEKGQPQASHCWRFYILHCTS